MESTENDQQKGGTQKRRLNSSIVAAGVALGLTLAGVGVASAQSDSAEDTTTTTAASGEEAPSSGTAPQEEGHVCHKGKHGARGTPLAADVADKVKAAALAAVPGGTFIRAKGSGDGATYHAHVRKADGTDVVVTLDQNFKVTGTEEHTGGPGARHRGGARPGAPDPQPETD